MIKQTISWTTLPKSSDGPKQTGTELRLSVYIAPRLWNDDATVATMPLSDFPDWLDWPARIGQATFEVEFDGGPTLPAVAENVDLKSPHWQALFQPTTTVKPFVFEDLSGAGIVSFSAGTILDGLKGIYTRVATDDGYGAGVDLPGRGVLAADPDIADIARPVEPPDRWVPPKTDRGPVEVGEPKPPKPDDDGDGGDGGTGEDDEPQGCREGCFGCLLSPLTFFGKVLKKLGLSIALVPMSPAQPDPIGEPGPIDEPDPIEGPGPIGEPDPIGDPDPPREPNASRPAAAAIQAGSSPLSVAPTIRAMAAVSAQQKAFNDLHAYMQPLDKVSVPLPDQAAVEDQYDFHQMISSLGDYPKLMRYMGLVVDLVVTLDVDLPADLGKVRLLPTIPLTTPTDDFSPWTHYELGNATFQARPGAGSDLDNGLLRLDDETRFRVVQTDVVGGGLKLQNTATNVRGMETLARWPQNAPDDAGLPTLQTAGISIVRASQVNELVRRVEHSYALNLSLAALDASPVPAFGGVGAPPPPSDELFAEDLVRGYRLDVLDDKSNAWHSLCRRVGDYEFGDPVDATLDLSGEEDEGFVQMASTEPLRKRSKRELRVHESLFGWDGWSLSAPRPGQTILPDQSVGEAENTAATQFKMTTAFRPLPGSLSRLRFGWKYRVRARAVDLAGNSVFDPDAAAFAALQPEATPEFQFGRYEPVGTPSLVLRAEPVEAESLENLSVTSNIHETAVDIEGRTTERHVVPPKTSQMMTERHGQFDDSPGIRKDQAAYDLASREAGSLTERLNAVTGTLEPIPGTQEVQVSPGRVYWLQTNETFEVAYLPDPFARGVLFMNLPGMASPDDVVPGVNQLAFDGAWPDLQALRLRLQGLDEGVAPALPAWDAVNRVLTVEVPQGEVWTVRYSSWFLLADLEQMGVWEWVQEASPVNLGDLRDRAVKGRNWLHLPFRELELVHAVREPLVIPDLSQLAVVPQKKLGETQVTLDGQVDIDAKSTGRVDLAAIWSDPHDDLAKASFDPATDFKRFEMQVAEVIADDPGLDTLPLNAIRHALGDTKYHSVLYSATAISRFREYFPAATDPGEQVRPVPAALPNGEVGTPAAQIAQFTLDIPNSTRPDSMKPLYAVPAFPWERSQVGDVVTHVRRSGGLRLYFERPWYSSGAGEQVGVVLRRPGQPAPLTNDWKALRKYVSEWGMDPLWNASAREPLATGDFANAAPPGANNLTLEELAGLRVDVVGFEPQYDTDRNLWFCDIEITGRHYFPFVRLALARFQPKSVPDAHLSRVVLSDFLQVLPERTVTYDLADLGSGVVHVEVRGPAYFNARDRLFRAPLLLAYLERRQYDTGDELGWETVPAPRLLEQIDQNVENAIWRGDIHLPSPAPSPARIVLLEAEIYQVDATDRRDIGTRLRSQIFRLPDQQRGTSVAVMDDRAPRIVFADTLELP